MTGRTLVRSVSLALFFALSVVFFPPGSSAASPATPPAEGVFRFPLFYVPAGLDPVRDSSISTTHVAQQIFDGLVAFDHELRVVPGLAESWTVSKDGREYLFSLRKGVRFHDGSSFEARDAAASLTRIFRPENLVQSTRFLDNIVGAEEFRNGKLDHVSGIRVISDYRIAITLKKPYAPFLAALAMPLTKIVPSELAGNADDTLSRHPVGTGPFRFVSWEKNTITLKANDGYFLGKPSLREVQFIFYPGGDRNRAFADFLKGGLEGCPLTAAADPSKLRKQGYQVLIRPRLALQFYGMNIHTPPFDNRLLRAALAHAFDRRYYVATVLGSKHYPAFQIIPPGMPGYTPENALLDYDPGKAAGLLAEAGYPGGAGLPELTIASVSHSKAAVKELALFAKDLARLGITVRPLFVKNWDEFSRGLEEKRYPIFRYAWYADVPDPDDFLSPLFESGGKANFTGFSDPEVDSLLERARSETDPTRRSEMYRKAERIILEKAPVIPVLNIATSVAFQGYVSGIDLPAIGTPYLPLRQVRVSPGS